MAIVGGTGSGRRVLAKIRHFFFCYNLNHFAAVRPQNKKMSKIQNLRRGEKEAKEKGAKSKGRNHLARLQHIDDKADAQIRRNQKVK